MLQTLELYFSKATNMEVITKLKLFHDEGPYHIEPSSLICIANQWAGFYMVKTSVMKELSYFMPMFLLFYLLKTENHKFFML